MGNFKYNKNKKQKLKNDSMNFGIHCNTFFQQKSSFPKFSVNASCEKT